MAKRRSASSSQGNATEQHCNSGHYEVCERAASRPAISWRQFLAASAAVGASVAGATQAADESGLTVQRLEEPSVEQERAPILVTLDGEHWKITPADFGGQAVLQHIHDVGIAQH